MNKPKYTVAPEDLEDHEIGLEVARVLGLRAKKANGRFDTSHGDKNPCGLARTVRHLANRPVEKAAPELLKALQSCDRVFGAPNPDPVAAFATIEKARAAISKALGDA